mmetsp:Transcript_20357/g.67995  ORF Transcript_20357/g.67995 Transcript_20357/m.67995 type:complete len:148 (-) Transcript_20357:3001-3444(-)
MVSQLDFNCVPPLKTFNAMGLEIRTLPVEHGPDCICYGFDFGVRDRVVYLSDFTSISEEVYEVIEEREVSILVLDSLRPDKDSLTHIGLPTAVEIAKRVKPKKTFLVGLSDNFGDHDEFNRGLRDKYGPQGIDIQLAHDGLRIPLEL